MSVFVSFNYYEISLLHGSCLVARPVADPGFPIGGTNFVGGADFEKAVCMKESGPLKASP